jgi:hypothetical protein
MLQCLFLLNCVLSLCFRLFNCCKLYLIRLFTTTLTIIMTITIDSFVSGYNFYREACALGKATTWTDFQDLISQDQVWTFKNIL